MSLKKIAARDEVWSGEKIRRVVDGVPVLLINVCGTICAYEDRCSHQRMPLSEGTLEGRVLTCPAHGWSYDASTGAGINPSTVRLMPFEVHVSGEDVFVDIVRKEQPRGKTPPRDAEMVGPVFEAGVFAAEVVAAIRESDPEVQVVDRGSYLRVLARGRCRLAREVLERRQGPVAFPRDVETIMLSFKGNLSISDEEMVWSLERGAT